MKQYSVVGNNKKVTMAVNNSKLKVVGNNCIVRVTVNEGNLEVVGNNCKVEVGDNMGAISLVGINALVSVSRRFTGDKVNLVGAGTRLVVDGKKTGGYEAQLSPFTKELDDVIDSIFTFVMR